MLDGLTLEAFAGDAFRVATVVRDDEGLADLNLTPAAVAATQAFRQLSLQPREHMLLDWPFAHPNENPTRFSPGRIGIFYSALEAETAQTEFAHWRVNAETPPLVADLFKCCINGQIFDLRPTSAQRAYLTDTNNAVAYPQCQALAAAAIGAGAQGFLAPSSRHIGGTTSPIFDRSALSNASIVQRIELRRDGAGNLLIRPAP